MRIIDEIGTKGIKEIFGRYGIDLKRGKDGFYYESYDWLAEETYYHYIDVNSDQDIANALNISVTTLYEEAQSCLAA